jgi:DNA-binding NtrC family response regulator
MSFIMARFRVLVVDDELAFCQLLSRAICGAGYEVDTAFDAGAAMAILGAGETDLVLCDIQLPDTDGIELIAQVRASGIDTPFIMCTAFASVDSAVRALKAGATDYIVKPVSNDEIIHRIRQIETVRNLRSENKALREIVVGRDDDRYRCQSSAMCEVERLVDRVSQTDSTVLVTGESGTGKGLVARMIHQGGAHRKGPFIPVNCSAIPHHLLESEFFGHTKGAFTGADKARKGLFLAAEGGTLFLDEVGELPLDLQPKLLNAIEDKKIRPVGGERSFDVDVRIIAATNRNLVEKVKQGQFREDLFFRMSMFQIRVPSLRERSEDIPGMIQFFLNRTGKTGVAATGFSIDAAAEEILKWYTWPGNIRELENVIGRACIMTNSQRITIDDLPLEISGQLNEKPQVGAPLRSGDGLRVKLRRIEASIVLGALRECGGDRKAAADLLEVSLSSLYRKLEECAEFGLAGSEVTEH